jgi:ABC-2 type transport system permease protein
VPIWFLPKPVQTLALWLPPYHFSQLALRVTGGSRGESVIVHVGAMAAAAMVFGAIAYLGYRRDEGKTYG